MCARLLGAARPPLLLGLPLVLLLLAVAQEAAAAPGTEDAPWPPIWLTNARRAQGQAQAQLVCPKGNVTWRGGDLMCEPCAEPAVSDPCELDVSNCSGVPPGGNCTIRCRAPFQGTPAVASCPVDNTNMTNEVEFEPPVCEVRSCPKPEVDPPGYRSATDARGRTTWSCAQGFAGVASASCGVNSTCAAVTTLSGCYPVTPCAAPVADGCKYDSADCDAVYPGASCNMSCKLPYVGNATVGHCPSNNTDPNGPLQLTMPDCELVCPKLTSIPAGYAKAGSGWVCARTHTGTVKAICTIDKACVARLRLTGCILREPCQPPVIAQADSCRLDASACGSGVAAGGTCTVHCRPPYVGSAPATCPDDNVASKTAARWVPPACTLACPDPDTTPPGYRKGPDGAWGCDEGYSGTAMLDCSVGAPPTCTVKTALVGCALTMPCWAPDIQDPCLYDVSGCYLLEPGEQCTVSCRPPFSGAATQAQCPVGNSDPWRMVPITPPQCDLGCPDPRPLPLGYARNASAESGWSCARGYVGEAVASCRHNRDCLPSSTVLGGCAPQPPCRPPAVVPQDAGCPDFSDCASVPAGGTCRVRCKTPFVGASTVATCPFGVTTATQLQWTPPSCTLGTLCPDPVPVPDGYWKDSRGQWSCKAQSGYVGQASISCVSNCRLVESRVSGCLPLVPCAPLVPKLCSVDASDCASVAPGRSCQVTCMAPSWSGGQTTATCPANNVDPTQVLTWTPPACTLTCLAPDAQPGYAWTAQGWKCAAGYTGSVNLICRVEEGTCKVLRAELTGCLQVFPCAPLPEQGTTCRYNVSGCARVPSGDSCSITCRPPYVGVPVTATCNPANINKSAGLLWNSLPSCYCPDPPDVPPGYIKLEAGWRCAEGYQGSPVKRCEGPGTCLTRPQLSGCALVVPCRPIDIDACELNVSACTGVMPGSTCEVACRPPYYGTPAVASCAPNNTDPQRPLDWTPPVCRLGDCPDLPSVPEGYARADPGWKCAEGYAGTVVVRCTTRPVCDSVPTLSGCAPAMTCAPLRLDTCRYDASSCNGTRAGSTCAVRCHKPYGGDPAPARCSSELLPQLPPSLPWALPLQWSPPQCSPLACADPMPVPEGYIKSASGWRCAEGYLGKAFATCRVDANCQQLPFILTGCSYPVPCVPLPVDPCMVDMSDCIAVPGGLTCTATCKTPFVGTPAQAMCPPGNTDPRQMISWVNGPPNCSLTDCLDPLPKDLPPGYVKTVAGWTCDRTAGAAGYAGDVVACCNVSSTCVPRLVLSGCFPVQPCTTPPVDQCLLDVSGCANASPGSTCEVHCRSPFLGATAVRGCPDHVPAACRESGAVDADCCATAGLGGCAPNFTYSALGRCPGYDPYDNVVGTCCQPQSRCGGAAVLPQSRPPAWPPARCVATAAGRWVPPGCDDSGCVKGPPPRLPLHLMAPNCTCPDPTVVPPGYIKVLGVWQCDEAKRYRGAAQLTCRNGTECRQGPPVLLGCKLMVPCLPPDPQGCRLNVTNCTGGVQPGASCQVTCRFPNSGAGTLATCPDDNTDPQQRVMWPPTWSPSACVFSCPDPSRPPVLKDGNIFVRPQGYNKTSSRYAGCGDLFQCWDVWSCATGYGGNVSFDCTISPQCDVQVTQVGCLPTQPCRAPLLSGEDKCMFDLSDCVSVAPGGTCTAKCRAPFAGFGTVASCPAGNTNTDNRTLKWTRPSCACLPTCFLQEGYNNTAGQWVCADGFAGEARWQCIRGGSQCLSAPELAGCSALVPCAAPSARPANSSWPSLPQRRLPAQVPALLGPGSSEAPQEQGSSEVGSRPRVRRLSEEARGLPVGVAWGRGTLTAFSSPADGCCLASAGRLYHPGGGGGWCADPASWPSSWLQVDLSAPTTLSAVATQGSRRQSCWVPAYEVWTSLNGANWRQELPLGGNGSRIFQGNWDRNTVVTNRFPDPVHARFVRFIPKAKNGTTACLRVEVYQAVQLDDWLPNDPAWSGQGYGAIGTWASSISNEGNFAFAPGNLLAGGRWKTAAGGMLGEWFVVNLQTTVFVSGIRVRGSTVPSRGEAAPMHMRLQVWNGTSEAMSDSWAWADVLTIQGSEAEWVEVQIEPPIVSRLFRLYLDDCFGDPGSNSSCSVTGFGLRGRLPAQWESLQDVHIDPACTFRELRGSFGTKFTPEACLAAGQAVPEVDHIIWRSDAGNQCYGCDVSKRGGVLTYVPADSVTVFTQPSAGCVAPWAVLNAAANGTCAEGFDLPLATNCTPQCAAGFTPSVPSLLCKAAGTLVPATFACLAVCEAITDQPYCEAAVASLMERDPVRAPTRCAALWEVTQESDSFASPGGGEDAFCGAEGCCGCPGQCGRCHMGLPECVTTTTTTRGCADDGWAVAAAAAAVPGFPLQSCAGAAPLCFDPVFGPVLRENCRLTCGTCAVSSCPFGGPCLDEDLSMGLCALDLQGCTSLGPNGTCQARCRAPLTGGQTNLTCPADNTDPTRVLQGLLPSCSASSAGCPDPEPIPPGYEKTATGWRCAAGYVGAVQLACNVDSASCGFRPVPSGCFKIVDCTAPMPQSCQFNYSGCANLRAGSSCLVSCLPPYTGAPATSVCPANNTDPAGLKLNPPACVSDVCMDPVDAPRGYVKGATSDGPSRGWTCAPGFRGTVQLSCLFALRKPGCAQPAADGDLPSDLECCPLPMQLQGCEEQKSCISCPQPSTPPEGFNRTASGNWICADGFTGSAVSFCSSCGSVMQLSGCARLVPCAAPPVDPCVFDISTCWRLQPGDSCQIYSRPPFVADTTTATCPAGNTDPARPLLWSLPEVVCPDPPEVPAGYLYNGTAWRCWDNYTGTAIKRCRTNTTCLTKPELIGCVQKQPCLPPTGLPRPCELNAASCARVRSGGTCQISCKWPPYAGGAVLLRCPADNVDFATPLTVTGPLPTCTFRCPDPVPLPAGYLHRPDGITWRCATGYTGVVSVNCSIDDQCNLTPTNLSGCMKMLPCAAPVADRCVYNLSNSTGLPAGTNGTVTCAAPYVGSVGWAFCLRNNTDASSPPSLMRLPQDCVLRCPDPPTVPTGYVKRGGVWQCADNYSGTVAINCTRTADYPGCNVTTNLSGCLPIVACVAPTVDPCQLNVANCASIPAGRNCSATCISPYTGTGATLSCPANNTNTSGPAVLGRSSCVLQCGSPSVQAGYTINSVTGAWMCASGYGGSARASCNISSDCVSFPVLSGCVPLMPCAIPAAPSCQLDFSACGAVYGGSSCQVSCKYPYVGTWTTATCPSGNTDPNRQLTFTAPTCTCGSVSTATTGYVSTGGGWDCDSGYGGVASVTCVDATGACLTQPTLTGCSPTVPCGAPVVPCYVNASGCSRVPPGGTCAFSCIAPYTGNANVGSCPLKNINASGGMLWSPPPCVCPEPTQLPTGYIKNGSNWLCAPGYEGKVTVSCSPDANCTPTFTLSGCLPLQPCTVPTSTATGAKIFPCLYNFSTCSNTSCGGSDPIPKCFCNPTCKYPYTGGFGLARCATGNTNFSTSLDIIRLPTCGLDPCPPVTQVVTGYRLTSSGGVECDTEAGYAGNAEVVCWYEQEYCNVTTKLVGCKRLSVCMMPDFNPCQYNFSDCQGWPNVTCAVTCRPPYTGGRSFAVCPPGNTDPTQALVWTPQTCSCPNPCPVIPGYAKVNTPSGWVCASGYAGTAQKRCQAPNNVCLPQPELLGCRKIVPCAPLEPDDCHTNVSACLAVKAGESCNVTCRAPYVGAPAVASCPVANTDPQRKPQWATRAPTCTLGPCPESRPVPVGYVKSSSGWRCAEGFGGQAVVRCRFGGTQCRLEEQLSGCFPLRNCSPLVLEACTFDTSRCQAVGAGGSCQVGCRAPYVGSPTPGTCPAGNIDPQSLVQVPSLPSCICPEPSKPQTGYVKLPTGEWVCDRDAGYLGGPVRIICQDGSTCFSGSRLSGCLYSRVPCKIPVIPPDYRCALNISSCAQLPPGSTCQPTCIWPHTGNPGKAACPQGNEDPNQEVIFDSWPPWLRCTILYETCVDPLPIPPGYEKLSNGWRCAAGYEGTAIAPCGPWGDCQVSVKPSGCQPVGGAAPRGCGLPTSVPESHRCRLDFSNCTLAARGQACEVRCLPPFSGPPSAAVCPADGDTALLWSPPQCDLEDCPPPPSGAPAGYVQGLDGTWACAAGFVGRPVPQCNLGTDCRPVLSLAGCTSAEVAAALAVPFRYNQSANLTPCTAQAQCGDPAVVQPGYRRTAKGWDCASGYMGKAVKTCRADRRCASQPTLSGCKPLQACAPYDPKSCAFDTTDCTGVPAGGFCIIRCKPPYYGPNGNATCPAGNTDAKSPMNVSLPACVLSCRENSVVPAGYVKAAEGWFCAPGYEGSAMVECNYGQGCNITCSASGCSPKQAGGVPKARYLQANASFADAAPCATPQVGDSCKIDVSNCTSVAAGASCTVQCKPPYVGVATTGMCPSTGGTDLSVTMPDCQLQCPTTSLPPGYQQAGGTTMCAGGWVGTAQVSCNVSRTCEVSVSFGGCTQLCQALDVDACRYNTTSCAQVPRGSTCTVGCLSPFQQVGPDMTWSCPANASANWTGALGAGPVPKLQGLLPRCTLEACPDPAPQSATGYMKSANGTWVCAPGYAGKAAAICGAAPGTCAPRLELAGCARLYPCVVPEADPCLFDLTNCWRLQPGATCQVRCKVPFVGTPTSASCPVGNTDPVKVISWSEPDCRCPDPAVPPVGYKKGSDGNWTCGDGFIGDASKSCRLDTACLEEPQLTGCSELVPCLPARTDDCQFDLSTCGAVKPGQSCQVACRWPYRSLYNGTVGCPGDNTDPTTPLPWETVAPVCELRCPDPSPPPVGYTMQSDGTWTCSQEFQGTASVGCYVEEGSCAIRVNATGCVELARCRAPFADPCKYDVSACSGLKAGETCQIRCTPPYVGAPSTGTCPGGNRDGQTVVSWSPPSCTSNACPEPPLPDGYVTLPAGGYACAPGYTGKAVKICQAEGPDCVHRAHFEGCALIVPCRLLGVQESCMYDVTDCNNVKAGSTCTIRCKPPFGGGTTRNQCYSNNTDEGGLVYTLPQCFTGSGYDPLPVQEGYLRTSAGWACAPQYAGDLQMQCSLAENCNTELQATGCFPTRPCEVEPFTDTDGRKGFVAGTLRFGPAQVEEEIDETAVAVYKVYFADDCGQTIGSEPLVTVNRTPTVLRCCAGSYEATVPSAAVPVGVTQLRFIVVASTTPLNVSSPSVGTIVPIEDFEDRPNTGGAQHGAHAPTAGAPLVLAGAVAAARRAAAYQ